MPFDLPGDYVRDLAIWLVAGAVSLIALLKLRRARSGPRAVWIERATKAGLSLWIFLAALTVVELYFAIIYDQSDSFNMSKVSQHWYARHVRENREGFRDAHPLPRKPPAGQRRLCFIGDSFTFGHGIKDVADRFSDRVGKRLDEVQPDQFVTDNVASPGIHVQLVENTVRKLVEHGFKIDILVYVICLNDIEAYTPAIEGMQKRLDAASPKFYLWRQSYFLNMLYFRIQQSQLPDVRGYYSLLADSYSDSPWEGMQGRLDQLRDLCQAEQIDLRVAIFPFLNNLGSNYPFDVAHERISEYCRERSIPCLDLKPILLPHVGEGLTVNRFDAHPNERAHALAAEALERQLLGDLFAQSPAP
jgi:hypothetical protein